MHNFMCINLPQASVERRRCKIILFLRPDRSCFTDNCSLLFKCQSNDWVGMDKPIISISCMLTYHSIWCLKKYLWPNCEYWNQTPLIITIIMAWWKILTQDFYSNWSEANQTRWWIVRKEWFFMCIILHNCVTVHAWKIFAQLPQAYN